MSNKYWFYWNSDDEIYFELGKGWYPVVLNAFEKFLNKFPNGDANFRVVQVKSKFAGLRIYTSFYDDEIDKIIEDAEEEAKETCEFCGSKSEVSVTKVGGWYSTQCKLCFESDLKTSQKSSSFSRRQESRKLSQVHLF